MAEQVTPTRTASFGKYTFLARKLPSPSVCQMALSKGQIRKVKGRTIKGFCSGGWARIDSIRHGKWEKMNPQPAILAIEAFMEKDAERNSHWVAVPEGKAVQGLLAMLNNEQGCTW